jgi:hypothetical protein
MRAAEMEGRVIEVIAALSCLCEVLVERKHARVTPARGGNIAGVRLTCSVNAIQQLQLERQDLIDVEHRDMSIELFERETTID